MITYSLMLMLLKFFIKVTLSVLIGGRGHGSPSRRSAISEMTSQKFDSLFHLSRKKDQAWVNNSAWELHFRFTPVLFTPSNINVVNPEKYTIVFFG